MIIRWRPIHTSSELPVLLLGMRNDLLWGIYRGDGSDYYIKRPGFVHAARPAGADLPDETRRRWTAEQARAYLRYHVADSRTARTAVRLTDGAWPIAAYVLTVKPHATSQLAQEWTARLIPEGDPAEIGYAYVTSRAELKPEQVDRILRDPLNLDCWALSDTSGFIYASVGTSGASDWAACRGDVHDGEAFFRDSAGVAWPMPHRAYEGYNCGYAGGGPEEISCRPLHIYSSTPPLTYRPPCRMTLIPHCGLKSRHKTRR
jgi:hypothetical protein